MECNCLDYIVLDRREVEAKFYDDEGLLPIYKCTRCGREYVCVWEDTFLEVDYEPSDLNR